MNHPEFSMAQLLPHDGRMLLLDEFVQHSDAGIMTAVTIRHDSVLCDGSRGVPAWVGMEYMAQAACAYAGVYDARAGLKPRIGLLLGTRSYQANVAILPLAARLIVSADLVMRDDADLMVFNCRITCNNEVLASGDIKAIRPADIHALIQEQLHGQ